MFAINKIQLSHVDIYTMSYPDFDVASLLEFLLPFELEKLSCFKSEKRKREFVATRLLNREVFGENAVITYLNNGAPEIQNIGHISISHANNKVAIAHSTSFELGLDLELIQDKILYIRNKFLNPMELTEIDSSDATKTTIAWSCKEALYKLNKDKGISLKNHIQVKEISTGIWEGKIFSNGALKKTKISVFQKDNVIYTVNNQALVNL